MNNVPRKTLNENEIQSTKYYVRNYQINMQNKPNFQKNQMNANLYNTKDYENKWLRKARKNKPNSNPNKPNLQKAKMNINSFITKDYRKKDDFEVRINKPNFRKAQNERKLIYSKGLQKKDDFTVQKTNQTCRGVASGEAGFKPNFNWCCPWDSLRRTVDRFENFSYCTKQT